MSENATTTQTTVTSETQPQDPNKKQPVQGSAQLQKRETVMPQSKGPSLADQHKEKTPTQTQTPAEKKEAERRKYKLKVDGEELEEELDDTEITTRLQKAKAAEKRMAEAAKLKKEFREAVEHGRKSPENLAEAVKKIFGVDFSEIAEKHLAQKYQESTLSPEELKQKQLEKELQEYKSKEERTKAQVEAQKRQQYEDQVWQETEGEILQALELGGYGKDKKMLALVSDVAIDALDHGIELSPQQMVAEVNKRLQSSLKVVLPNLKGAKLLEFLGTDTVKAVLGAELERRGLAQTQNANQAPAAQPSVYTPKTRSAPKPPEKAPEMSASAFRRNLRLGRL